jgi:ABC-type lipoprotein release transport system permease subunit
VRLALGAANTDILRHVLWHGVRPALAGLAAGCAMAVEGGLLVRTSVLKVTLWDPAAYALAATLLLAVAAAACLVPARRASQIDPSQASRKD